MKSLLILALIINFCVGFRYRIQNDTNWREIDSFPFVGNKYPEFSNSLPQILEIVPISTNIKQTQNSIYSCNSVDKSINVNSFFFF